MTAKSAIMSFLQIVTFPGNEMFSNVTLAYAVGGIENAREQAHAFQYVEMHTRIVTEFLLQTRF